MNWKTESEILAWRRETKGTVAQAAEHFGLPPYEIRQVYEKDSKEYNAYLFGINDSYPCARCGTLITAGRLCVECLHKDAKYKRKLRRRKKERETNTN